MYFLDTKICKKGIGDFILFAKNYRGGGFCPSLKICGGIYPCCKKERGDFVLVVKTWWGIISTYTKMTRGDSVRGILFYTHLVVVQGGFVPGR